MFRTIDYSYRNSWIRTGTAINWYTGSCGGTYVGSGASIVVTPGATTYYARTYNSVCGNYSATCTPVTVTVNSNPTVSVNSPSVCSGNNATVTATPSPSGTYNYSWTVPGGATNPGNTNSFTTGVAGTYTVTITNGNGCTSSSSGTVTVNSNPTVSVNSPSVCSGNNATVTATPSPSGTYNYSWTVPGGATNPGNTNSFTTGVAGTYTVTITNGNGCTSSSSGTVTVNSNPTVSVNSPSVCSGNNATVTATPSPSGTYNYSWTVPGGATNPGNTNSFTTGVAGTYTVTITSGNGCTSSSSGTVTVNSNPTVSVNSPSVCSGNNATVTATPSPSGTYNYSWTVPGGATNPGNTNSFTTGVAGTYTVTITNGSGCTSSSSGTVTVISNIAPAFDSFGPYCTSDVPPSLPSTSNNGITGTWNPSSISTASAGSVDYTFTPAGGQCATPITISIVTNNCCPTITCPENVSISACNQAIPSGATNVAQFNAIDATSFTNGATISFSDVSNTVGCTVTTTRTYTANNSGGTCPVSCQQIITRHVDAVNPTASNPTPISVQCVGLIPAADISVVTDEADNCGAPTVTFVNDVSNGASCPEIITRTYKVADACNNFINVTQTITVGDNIPPTASNPAPISAQCSGLVPASDISVVTDEADNCGIPTVTFVNDVSNGASCPEIITRTYKVADACNNFINVTQTITVGDNIPPTASNPVSISVQCSGLVPASDVSVVTDEADNCGIPIVTFVNDVSNGASCPEIITRTYKVADACNNFINVTQTITVGDNIPPTASNPAPISVQCSSLVPAANISVVTDEADNCSLPSVTFVSDVSNGATCPEIITRTYRVSDACNNFINVTQTITVGDNIPPTASNPAPISVQCIGLIPIADISVVTDEADNCSVPTVTFRSDVSNGATCPEIITRTYRVTDACGNFTDVTQTITVGDNISPTASNPTPISVQCSGLIPVPDISVVTDEADNCGVPTVTFVSDVSNGATCPEIITRTYKVADACNNFINVTQTITVGDNIPPTASNSAPISVQCIGLVPVADVSVVTDEADNCGVPTVTFVSDVSNGATCPEIITRTYKVADACNNFINVTQTITVGDNIPPTASNPAPISVQCMGLVPVADISVVTDEADNCGVPTVTFVNDVSNGSTCPSIITRTYKVSDACSNFINVTQTISVGDNIPPTASNPAPISVQCIGLVPIADISVVTDEADNCGVPIVTFVNDVSNGASCPEIITRTYKVADACNNFINVTQTITVGDNIPPTASNPAPISVQCIGLVPVADVSVVTDEADNCGVPTVTFVSDVSNGATCPEIITRTYKVSDACDNFINVTQMITVGDDVNPTASNPPTISVQCAGLIPASDVLVVTDEADNCSVPTVTFIGDVSNGATCPETITRTYKVSDACNNFINVTQTITVGDDISPTASNPAPISVQCLGLVPVPDVNVVTDEADNCTVNPLVAFVSDVSNGATCPEIITRTYSVTDACAHSINVAQIITVGDDIPPTADPISPMTVQCHGDIPVADISVVTGEADNCTAIPTVTFVSDVSNGSTCPEIITRTYKVSDACNNFINVTQTITVGDNIPPTASNPAPISVQCIGLVPLADITAVTDEADNCGVPTVTFVNDVSNGLTCPETITRTYKVADACDNFINVTQTITVGDDVNPTASNPPTISVQCAGLIPASDVLVVTDEADNCSVPTVTFIGDVSNGATCPETITRTYKVSDACNNFINVTQTITVGDDISPTASNPAPISVQCLGLVPVPDVSVVTDEADNCTVNPLVTFVSDVSNGATCPETISRTYKVSDVCNNFINVIQNITVGDNIPPVVSNCPSAQSFCQVAGDNYSIPQITATDNCTANPSITYTISGVTNRVGIGVDASGLFDIGTSTIVWTVTDECNNSSTCSVTVTINENVLPTFTQLGPYCLGGASGVLPSTSNNGITGTWSPATINTAVAGSSTYTFTPTVGLCATQATMSINITSIILTATPTSPLCNGGNGSISFTSTGGVGSITYKVNGANATSPYVNTAGIYTVSATDANGCTSTMSVTITEPEILDAYFTSTNVTCNGGNNGSIDLTVEGGTTDYSYVWSDASVLTQDRTGLIAGSYIVTVTDANGCTKSVTIPITQPGAIVVSGSITHVSCFNGNNGAISTTTVGGTPGTPASGYSYAWNSGHQAQNISNLVAGTYVATVTDSRGCTGTNSFVVNQPPIITISGDITHPSCNGLANGGVDITVGGGVPGYSYHWNPTGSGSGLGQDLTGASDGNYTVTVTDANTCTMTSSYTLIQPSVLSVTFDVVDMTCDSTNGSITLHPSGGTPNYTYLWDASAGNAATPSVSHLTNNDYSVTITDSHACTLDTTITVNRVIPPNITLTNLIHETCSDTNAVITISVNDGTPDFHYVWSNNSTNDSPTISNISQGTYIVTITDNDGCVDTAVFVVTNHEAPVPAIASVSPAHCDQFDGVACIVVTGGTGVYTYDWGVYPPRTSNCESNLNGNTYTVMVSDSICNVPIDVIVPNLPGPTAIGSAYPTAIGVDRANIHFTDNSVGATNWYWDFGTGNYLETQNPVYKYEVPGNYNVVLTVTDEYGCTDTDTIPIVIFEGIEVWIPNAFSPNGDGLNDEFGPICNAFSLNGYEMIIYDRWGKQCFYSNDYFNRWNGFVDGSRVLVNTVFVYRITIYDLLGKDYIYTGRVSLIYSTE